MYWEHLLKVNYQISKSRMKTEQKIHLNWYDGINLEWLLTVLVRSKVIRVTTKCKLGRESFKLAIYSTSWIISNNLFLYFCHSFITTIYKKTQTFPSAIMAGSNGSGMNTSLSSSGRTGLGGRIVHPSFKHICDDSWYLMVFTWRATESTLYKEMIIRSNIKLIEYITYFPLICLLY